MHNLPGAGLEGDGVADGGRGRDGFVEAVGEPLPGDGNAVECEDPLGRGFVKGLLAPG